MERKLEEPHGSWLSLGRKEKRGAPTPTVMFGTKENQLDAAN